MTVHRRKIRDLEKRLAVADAKKYASSVDSEVARFKDIVLDLLNKLLDVEDRVNQKTR